MPRRTSLSVVLGAVALTTLTCSRGESAAPPAPAARPAPTPPPVAAAAAPAGDKNAALTLSDIPGMSFAQLPPPAQKELATVLTDEFCYCGCPHTLGACLKQHTGCRHAKRMAILAAGAASQGTPATEIIVALSRYYRSFREKRAAFKPDDRMCQGPKDAKVTVVEFSDFECPYCAAARPMLEALVKAKPGVRLCSLPFPLPGHPHSMPASRAVLYARDQGKFWPMHDALFENQKSLSPEKIKELGKKLGLDVAKAMEGQAYDAELNQSKELGHRAGVDATPAIFVNGRKLELSIEPSILAHTADDELEWLGAQGAWAAD